MRKRILSACMALCLMLTMLPVNALAADPPATDGSTQIEGSYYTYDPQDHEFSPDGDEDPEVTNRSYEPNVTISKEIQATDVENQFDITLTVKTDEAIEVSTKEPDAAIVLVIDVSTSMDYCASCGQFYGHAHWCENQDQTRLDAAKEAAKDFLADYAQGAEGAARYVSGIAYSDASGGHWSKGATAVVQDWVDVSSGNALYTINEEIDNIDSYTDRNGTNTDAGLEAAEDQLQERDVQNIDNKFLLLLTDGEPNRSTGDELDWRAGYVLPDGYPQDNYRGESYTNPARRAMYIRNELDTEFYSISYTAGSSVSGWMKSFSDLCVTADNGDDLSIAFEDIIFRLQLTVDAWKVTDPMGEYIEYEGVENANSHANGAVSYNRNRDTLTWDLRADLASDATTIVDSYGDLVSYDDYEPGMDCTITYSLTYRVTLDVAAMVDDEIEFTGGISDYVLTNGPTQLDYYLTKTVNGESVYVDDNGDDIESGENPMLTMYFKVPKVRGYVGTLEFTKVDEKSDALSGAGFTLTMEDDNWSTTAESDEYGVVQFENIPSGHTYTLEETEVPEGYVKTDDITITVQYGNVTYRDGSFGTGTDDGLTLVNQPTFVPDPGLTVKKELTSVTRDGATLSPFDAETYVAQVGDTLHYTITVTNTGNTEQSGTITDTFTVGGGSATLEKLTAEPADSVDFDETPWTFSGLASKGTITITADYTVQPGDKSISNGVSVTGTEDTPEDPDPDDNTVETDVASLTVEKKTDRETAFVGDTITYTVTVTNTGDVDITDVVRVEDSMWGEGKVETIRVEGVDYALSVDGGYWNAVMPDGPSGSVESLEPGDSWTCTYTYTVTTADAEAGKVANVVTADSDQTKDPDPDDPTDPGSDSTETTILPSATEVTKYVVTSSAGIPDEILEELDGLDITYPAPASGDGNPQIVASAGDKITLLYEISVFGDEGASFTVTEESGANFIGAVGAEGEVIRTLSEPPQYAGQIGEGARYATLYFTKTFEIGETTTTLTNSITAVVNGEEEDVTEEVDVVKPGLNVDKTVKINGEDYVDGMVANEKDVLTYTITVKNTGKTAITDTVTVSDSMWIEGKVTQVNLTLTEDGKTITLPANVSEDGTLTVNPVSSVDTVFEPGETWTCTYTYTVTAEDVIAGSVSNTVTAESGNGDESTDEVTVPAGSITITPADITIYTGGKGYSNVLDESGTPIATTAQGFPEPGYHLTLPDAVKEWLRTHNVATGDVATNLAGILSFRYYDENGNMIRNWNLEDQGVYSKAGDVITAYVYSLSPNTAAEETGIKVRLQVTNPDDGNSVVFDDDIDMDATLVSDQYTMKIYSGELDQSKIKAVFTVGDDSITCNVEIGTGELLVKSVTDIGTTTNAIEDNGDAVASGTLTAVADSTVHYYVNDSEVTVDPDRVQLLVDSVSNSTEFNRSMEQDAINKADAQDGVSLSNAQAESFYLDLVDTDNGNTVVTLGDDDKLTIYWPMPDDADENGDFYIVHYTDMNRENVTTAGDLASAANHVEKVSVTPDGDHLTFTVDSFSPFVLVYEKEDSGSSTGGGGSSRPSRPTLNTEDHYSYIIGYSDGTLQPYGTITRGEVATIFFRLLTDDSREEWWSQVNDYSDCNSDLWCNNAISTLSNMGIIDGFSDGTFRPYAKITRAQFAKIAVGFFETTREDYQGYFTDVDIDAWYTEYVEAAARVGLIEGFNNGTFRPNTNITRAQACVIVNRALGRAPDEDRLLDEDEMITWPDNNPDDWFYADMQEATNSHDYTWTTVSGDKVENWTDKLPQRDWAALEHAWSTAHSAPGGEVTE